MLDQINVTDRDESKDAPRCSHRWHTNEGKVATELKAEYTTSKEDDEERDGSNLALDLGTGREEDEEVESKVDESGVEKLRSEGQSEAQVRESVADAYVSFLRRC